MSAAEIQRDVVPCFRRGEVYYRTDTGRGWRADFARIGFSGVIIYPGSNTDWW